MLQLGVIQWSYSTWRSPIVLVPKLDGTVWFCINFREVNHITQVIAYPMLWAEVLIKSLSEARFLSTLDLTRGYWKVPLQPKDKEKTTLATSSGL